MPAAQQQVSREAPSKHQDFSQAAVSRAVLAATAQKPYVLYPTAVGILGAAAAVLLGPSSLFVVPAVLGGAVGLGSWAVDYFLRRDHHASAYLQDLHRALSDRRGRAVRDLERELSEIGSKDGLAQLERLGDKLEAFQALLDKKLDPSELTHGRYLGMAEQVYLSGLDNLQRMVHTLASIEAIDEDYVESRVRTLKRIREPSASKTEELESLRARLALKEAQRAKVDHWLAQNERAMTQIDSTMAAIAAMDTVRGHAGTDLETAMRELAELARRAPDYNIGGEGD
ncbi:MAG: hypothetical protein LJE70_10300 [Chromatiaceae bacterium]|jgi:hypothetical protein|nr:hypothetical protein [Chromatiaceae bacterium]